MAREDDYRNAAAIARSDLAEKDPALLADRCGAEIVEEGGGASLELEFLGKRIRATWPDVGLSRPDSDEEVPIQQQVLLLHYLQGAWKSGGPPVTGDWMAFQDVPDGKFYQDAFQRRAKLPLLKAFGERPELLADLARTAYGAERVDLGDVAVAVEALPRIRVALVVWAGDEEFPPDGNILFDRNTASYFSAEDIAWLAGMIVYPLMGMAAASAKGKTVLVLDGLNQLEDRDNASDLGWLPEHFPPNVRLIASTLPGRSLDAVMKRGWLEYTVKGLDSGERIQMAGEYLSRFGKRLSPQHLDQIVYSPRTENPLYLKVLLDELRVFGEHEALGKRIDQYMESKTIPDLYTKVLERLESDY